ncbi:hypothetical protein CGZ94_04765 [Enemella evansiae]|uniref:DUF2510 domain-containing protein n=1 Tax=Enemella evansiae TaxID=2016499 RepID=A0A255GL13_9ACTN|nr:hypothetical protein [Enemella evansiae]OYO16261.1 hypothetical protein CGZ94_04765 [Enemella evansiae]
MPVPVGRDLDPELGPRPDPSPRPGWYPDPRELDDPDPEPAYRWWDGRAWTAWLADTPYAPSPRGPAPSVLPRAELRRPRSARWLLAVLVLTSLLLGLTALSIYGRSLPQAVPEAPTPSSLGTPQRTAAAWGFRDRTVILGERLEMTLAEVASPDLSVQQVSGLYQHCWVASTQQRSDEKQSAQQVLGYLDPTLVVPGDSAATARRTYEQMRVKLTASVPLEWSPPRIEPWPGLPGATRVTAEVRYQSPDPELVPEEVTMLVLPWQNGRASGMGVWLTLVPTNAPAEVRDSLTASQATIRLVG